MAPPQVMGPYRQTVLPAVAIAHHRTSDPTGTQPPPGRQARVSGTASHGPSTASAPDVHVPGYPRLRPLTRVGEAHASASDHIPGHAPPAPSRGSAAHLDPRTPTSSTTPPAPVGKAHAPPRTPTSVPPAANPHAPALTSAGLMPPAVAPPALAPRVARPLTLPAPHTRPRIPCPHAAPSPLPGAPTAGPSCGPMGGTAFPRDCLPAGGHPAARPPSPTASATARPRATAPPP